MKLLNNELESEYRKGSLDCLIWHKKGLNLFFFCSRTGF